MNNCKNPMIVPVTQNDKEVIWKSFVDKKVADDLLDSLIYLRAVLLESFPEFNHPKTNDAISRALSTE